MYYRFLLCDIDGSGNPKMPNAETGMQSYSRMFDFGGKAICRVEFDPDQFKTYTDTADYSMLPSLQAPATRMQSGHQTFFTSHGVTIASGDAVINVLRSARNLSGFECLIDDAN